MTRHSVYIETTVIGHLAARLQRDPIVAGSNNWSPANGGRWRPTVSDYSSLKLFWMNALPVTSNAAAERLAFLKTLEFVRMPERAKLLAAQLHLSSAIPSSEPRDAFHISIAATNGIESGDVEFHAHRKRYHQGPDRRYVPRVRLRAPRICTPDELLGV